LEEKIIYDIANFIDDSRKEILKYSIPEVNEASINLSQLRLNVNTFRSLLKPNIKFMAVLKGDAYGHGIIPIAQELENCKCDNFGVVRLIEALTLREARIKTPIIMLAPLIPSQALWAVKYDVTPMVDNERIVEALEICAAEKNKIVKIHIKINTGLNRYGINPEEALDFIRNIYEKYSHIEIEGLYTHFKDAEFDIAFTNKQIRAFDNLLQQLEKANLRPPIAHAAGSAGILSYPESHYDMVRCGLILYGLEYREDERHLPEGVKPLLSLKGKVLKIQKIKKGQSVGYGNKFTTERDTYVAIIGAGYGDGIARGWKEVLVAGRRVPVVNYFMDGIIADITELKNSVHEFDEVVIVGQQGIETITWEEACNNIASHADEQIQRITKRVPRRYFYE
jgi:alanine racemase